MQDAPLYYSMEKIWVQSLAGFCLVNIFPFLSMCWSKCEMQVWKHWQHIFKYIVFCFVLLKNTLRWKMYSLVAHKISVKQIEICLFDFSITSYMRKISPWNKESSLFCRGNDLPHKLKVLVLKKCTSLLFPVLLWSIFDWKLEYLVQKSQYEEIWTISVFAVLLIAFHHLVQSTRCKA